MVLAPLQRYLTWSLGLHAALALALIVVPSLLGKKYRFRQEKVVWGGNVDGSGGRYDPATDTWRSMSTAGAPIGRWDASVVWTGNEMIIWGGTFPGMTLNDGGRYNPSTDTWTALPAVALAPRAFHAAVWTGTDMIVWGGYDGFIGQMYGDGARYRPANRDGERVDEQVVLRLPEREVDALRDEVAGVAPLEEVAAVGLLRSANPIHLPVGKTGGRAEAGVAWEREDPHYRSRRSTLTRVSAGET